MSMRPSRTTALRGAVSCGLALLLLAGPAAAGRPQESIDSLCLSHLLAGASKLGRDTVKQLGKCHSQRLNGHLPAGTDCNSESNAPWADLRARDADSLRIRARKRCHVASASPPAAMGFGSCPAPCEAAITTYADVAECLICQVHAIAETLAASVYGTPEVPAGSEKACFSRLTRVIRHYLGARLKGQRSCQTLKDSGRLHPSVHCTDHDPTGIVTRARALIPAGVAACSDVDLQALDSCGRTVADEATCLQHEIDAAAGRLFEAVY